MSVEMETALSEKTVHDVSRRRGEPGWVQSFRNQGFEAYRRLALPSWDRTDISTVDFEQIAPFEKAAQSLPQAVRELVESQAEQASILIQHHSETAYRQAADELAAHGVVFCSLDTALRDHGELVREHLGSLISPEEDKLAGLQAALMSGGLFVYVPRDVDVEVPLQYFAWADTPGASLFPRILVVADRGSRVTVLEGNDSQDADRPRIVGQSVEVIALDNSKVTYGAVQSWGPNVVNLTTRRAKLHRDASVDWILADLGSGLTRVTSRSLLVGEGSQSSSLFVFFADGRQHLDVAVAMQHFGHYTSSDMQGKGVLKDEARCVYRGLTDIENGAQNTTAFQRENTLILSNDARADAIPELEIDETEVQAGHAATVGQIDDVQLFYLMSRGLPERKAIELIVDGFFDPIIERIPLESLRGSLRKRIAGKMRP